MVYQTLCNWLTGKKEPLGGELYAVGQFRGILERERMRADRSNSTFALAVFSQPKGSMSSDEWSEFIEHVRLRVRATDHAGHMESQKIGVALWDTDAEGAWKFVEQVHSAWTGAAVPVVAVYVYPGLDFPYNSSMDRQVDGWKHKHAPRREHESASAASAVAQPLEALFVRPLPFWKRLIDIAGAGVGLLLVSPVLAVTAVMIKLTSPGPVMFRQLRDGAGGKLFTVYKFRTMQVGADAQREALLKFNEQDGPAFKMKNDPRVIPMIGRFLRKSCIDELPQLWNVLRGDMSLVGPRPLLRKETSQISQWQRRRLDVTPGLTCIWQVYGKSRVTFTEWMRMDIRYLLKRSFVKDMKLICSTFLAVVFYRVAH